MERTKKITKTEEVEVEEGVIMWKKVGGGSLRIKGRIIKPNETFKAHPSEISAAFRDSIIPLEELPKAKPIVAQKEEFTVERKSGQYYNVVNSKGKVMNEKGLLKEDAEKLKLMLEE